MELREKRLRISVGLADSCELMAAAFAFPVKELAVALSGGSFQEDCVSCLKDAGVDWGKPCAKLAPFEGRDAASLFSELRKGHSLLYLAPGGHALVWAYESPFLFAAAGGEGEPALFRSGCQMDVERHMREAGVLPKDARTEPIDSVWSEFSFLSFLYGNVAKSLHEGRADDAGEWSDRIVRFWDEHASKWMAAFMERTVEKASGLSCGAEYAALAEVGLAVLEAIRADVDSFRAS